MVGGIGGALVDVGGADRADGGRRGARAGARRRVRRGAPSPHPYCGDDNTAAHDDSTDVDAVLSVGEVQGLPCQPARFAALSAGAAR